MMMSKEEKRELRFGFVFSSIIALIACPFFYSETVGIQFYAFLFCLPFICFCTAAVVFALIQVSYAICNFLERRGL